MPINPSALGGDPAPDDPDDAPEVKEQIAAEGKRSRRSKAQLIADAVVPADDEQVKLKDAGTGAKIERPWLVALEMVREGKAEWADKAMKYAVLKYDQPEVTNAIDAGADAIAADVARWVALQEQLDETGASETEKISALSEEAEIVRKQIIEAGGTDPASDEGYAQRGSVPPEAEVGDEVLSGKDVFRVGHGGVLTTGPVEVDGEIVQPRRAWQRELGTGGKGPWEVARVYSAPTPAKAESNGKGNSVEPVVVPDSVTIEQVSERGWRIGTGILEKIGLPDYSSLQIGPITASREVQDDGRRTTVQIGEREAEVPTACLDIAQQACDIVEYIARYQRGELVSFLESTGALKQPVSA